MSISILSTKILTSAQKFVLTNAQIQIEDYDAIKIEHTTTHIDPSFKNIIFTSQNTVKAFLKKMGLQNVKNANYNGFCVGEKTNSLLKENGVNVLEMTNYGVELAQILTEKYPNETFLFLCGNKRRNEIPALLSKHKVSFKEQIIYHNTPNPLTFATDFDGILFFSPSAIESFTTKNNLRNCIAFCIGNTTAAEAKKHSKKIIVAEKPTVESVLDKVVAYSKTKMNQK